MQHRIRVLQLDEINFSSMRRSTSPVILLAALACLTWLLVPTTTSAQCGTNTQLGGQSGCTRSNFYLGEWLPNAGCGVATTISNYGPGYYFRMPVLQGGCYTVNTCGAGIDTHINAFEGTNTTGPFAYDDDGGPYCSGLAASLIMTPNFTDYARIDVRQYPCNAGGSSSITVQLWQNNNLNITSSAANMCQGQTRTLTATPARVVATPQPGSGDVGTFSGTGVSGTTFSAPTPAGNSASYSVTYTFGYCSTSQSITVFRNPTVASAGPDQLSCGTTATLAANTPTYGTGAWSIVSGPGTVTTPASPTSTVTGLVSGTPTTLRWTISNGPCTASTDDVVITVDNVNPSITCPANISLSNTTGQCAATGTFTAPTGTDNCPGSTTAQIAGLASGSSFPVGTTVNTFRVTDAQGRTATCSFNITVVDVQTPAITCPANISVNTTTGACSGTATYTAPSGSDNCAGVTSALTGGLASGATYPLGVTTNIYRATDAAGNTATCSFTVTVVDAQVPSITCPANSTVTAGTGACTATFTYTAPTGTDNCSGSTTTQTGGLASGATYPLGVTTNIFRVTDAAGNTSTCAFTVTVNDGQAPSITCPANGSATATTGTCAATFSYTAPTGTDNCSGVSTTQTAGLASGASFPVGVTTNTFRATDAAGNSTTCSFTVTVTDGQVPAISCPANASVSTTTGACTATFTYTAPTGTDNCAGVTTTQTAGLASGSAFPLGSTANTFLTTDAAGNTATCSFTVTVTDGQAPSITCPANAAVNATSGTCSAAYTYTAPTGTDNCTGSTTTLTGGLASGATFPLGATTNTFQVTDAAGNTGTCSFTVTVNDAEAPSLTCPANGSANAVSGTCSGTFTFTAPSGADNCAGVTTTQTAGLASGATYPVGTTVNTFRATDAAGNTTTCSFNVVIIDAEAPSINCPPSFTANVDPGNCSAVIPYPTPTGADNCAGVTISQTAGLPTNTAFPVGGTTCTFLATDAAGNTTTCTFVATVVDNIAPTINCPGNVSANSDIGTCAATVNYTVPTGSDNCPGTTGSILSGSGPGSSFPVGTTTNTFQLTDASGNTATCSFNVVVLDVEAPAITCPANVTVPNATGTCGATATFVAPTGTDNCAGVTTTQTGGLPSGSVFPVGSTLIKFQATDAAGNTTSCAFNVDVTDAEAPAINCPATLTVNSDPGNCSATVTYTAPAGTDNCTGVTTSQTAGLASGSIFPIGTTANTYRATDAAGNSTSCSFDVVVVDNQAPALNCPANITVSNQTNACGAVVTYSAPVGTDNCAGATTTMIAGLPSGSNFPTGATAVTYRTTDANGNSTTCSFNVTVNDVQAPTWSSCPSNISLNAGPSCNANATWTAPSALDNCALSGTNSTHTPGASFSTGTTAVIYTATDVSGNTTTCSFNVTVTDNTPPTALCTFTVVNLDSSGNGSITEQDVDAGSSDNCGQVFLSINQLNFTCANAGNNVLTLTVSDLNGNTATCTANVSVVPPAMSGSITADTTTCGYNLSCSGSNDGIAHAQGVGGCPSYTYLWSTGATTATATNLPAGISTVTITDGTGATDVQTVNLTAPIALSATGTATGTCPGTTDGAIDLTANGGNDCQAYTFLWSTGASTEDIGGLAPGNYTVTVTDVSGCTTTQTITVPAFAVPNPTFTQNGLLLTSSQTWVTYQWLLNGGPISGANASTYTVQQTGSYSLQVTDTNGCSGISDTTNVTFVGTVDPTGDWASMSIYPNPARGQFRLRTDMPIAYPITLRVTDIYGRTVAQRDLPELAHETTVSLDRISSGTYLVELTSDQGHKRVWRLVVQ